MSREGASASRTRRAVLRSAAAGIAAVPAVGEVGAQSADTGPAPDRRVLFDVDRDRLGTVSLDGQQYHIYAFENRIEAASGIELWTDTSEVTDSETVDQVLEAYVWTQTVDALLSREDRIDETFGAVLDDVRGIEEQTGEVLPVLDSVLDQVGELEAITIDAGFETYSAWDILTTVYPTVGAVASGARSLRDRLESWNEAARSVQSALPPLMDFLDTTEQSAAIDHEQARGLIRAARSALSDLSTSTRRLQSDVADLEQSANEALTTLDQSTATIVEEIARETDVPSEVIDFFRDSIDEILGTIRAVVNRLFNDVIDPLLSPVRELEEQTASARDAVAVDPGATERIEPLQSDWEQRRNAETTVNVPTAGAALTGALLLLGAWTEPTIEPGDLDE